MITVAVQGRDYVSKDDLQTAIQLVILPRALIKDQNQDQQDDQQQPPPPPPPPPQDQQQEEDEEEQEEEEEQDEEDDKPDDEVSLPFLLQFSACLLYMSFRGAIFLAADYYLITLLLSLLLG